MWHLQARESPGAGSREVLQQHDPDQSVKIAGGMPTEVDELHRVLSPNTFRKLDLFQNPRTTQHHPQKRNWDPCVWFLRLLPLSCRE